MFNKGKRCLMMTLAIILILSISISGCGVKGTAVSSTEGNTDTPEVQVVNWKMQAYVPPGNIYWDAGQRIVDIVKELSGGNFTIDYLADGTIVETSEMLYAVESGTLDAAFTYSALDVGLSAAAPLFCSVPGDFDIQSFCMWMDNGGGNELLTEMYEPYGVVPFFACIDGMETFLWANKPIKTIDDLKSSTIRMMPVFGDVLQANGVPVVFLPGSEIIPSLDRKVIDAGEYSIPAYDIDAGFADVCKYMIYPGIHSPFSTSQVNVNAQKWAELPEEYKNIFEYAIKVARYENWIDNEVKNIDALDKLRKMGIEVVVMEDEAVQTMLEWTTEYMDALEAKDEFFAKVRQSQKTFLERWYPYSNSTTLKH